MLFCFQTDKLPHNGGLMDQPAQFVRDLMTLKNEVNEKERQEAKDAEDKASALRSRVEQGA